MNPVWRKSSRSTTQGGECIEVAALSDGIGMRDSKNPQGDRLTLTRKDFAALVQRIRGLA